MKHATKLDQISVCEFNAGLTVPYNWSGSQQCAQMCIPVTGGNYEQILLHDSIW